MAVSLRLYIATLPHCPIAPFPRRPIAPFNALVSILLEPNCAACDSVLARPLASPVCDECWRGVIRITPPCCVRCGEPTVSWRSDHPFCVRCRRGESPIAMARSAARYEGSVREILHTFKYGGRRLLAPPLGRMMRTAGEDLLAGADAVVPVPLHPWRAFRRGFNQADDLARELGLPVWRVLRRTRHGPPQAGLPAARRHANVRHAFALRRLPTGLRSLSVSRLIRNRVVVIVDDVMTTGATIDACGRVLLEAGARSVRALTLARAATGPPSPRLLIPRPSISRRR